MRPEAGTGQITLGAAITGGKINLAAGADGLTLGNFTKSVTVSNIEAITLRPNSLHAG
jgi:hypothetical protein